MPGKIKVKILAARNLPIMDRSAETTDAFCEVKLGTTTYKTDVYRKSLNPQWNSEWYRFEMDDAELQDEPLQIRVMDHDTYSANDAIGKLYLDLNPLLHLQCMYPTAKTIDASAPPVIPTLPTGSVLSGWFPVYDTMHGIRGEVHVTVKVELFSDFNKFRESSCGVQFFCSSGIPYGHNALAIHGFVEELIKTSDPEYQWIEKIRTPRVTNEARQTTFFKLSGEVHRKIGLKVIDMGGNAVIGYIQSFDLEGESGIVARGIGTVVTLVKIPEPISTIKDTSNEDTRGFFRLPTINVIAGSPTMKGSPYTPPKRHRNAKKLYSRFPRKTNSFFSNTRMKLGKRHLQTGHDHRSAKKDHLSKSTESLDSKDDSSSVSSFQFDLQTMKSQRLMSAISSSTSSLSKKLTSLKQRQSPDRNKRKQREAISFLITSIAKDPVFNFGHVYDSIEEESVKNLSVDLSKMSSRSSDNSASELGSLSESSSIITVGSQSMDYDVSDMVDTESLNLRAEDAKSSLNNASIESDQRQSENVNPEAIPSSEIKESLQDIPEQKVPVVSILSKTSSKDTSVELDLPPCADANSEGLFLSENEDTMQNTHLLRRVSKSSLKLALVESELFLRRMSKSSSKLALAESELCPNEELKSTRLSGSEMDESEPNIPSPTSLSQLISKCTLQELNPLLFGSSECATTSSNEIKESQLNNPSPNSIASASVGPSKDNLLKMVLSDYKFSDQCALQSDQRSQICLGKNCDVKVKDVIVESDCLLKKSSDTSIDVRSKTADSNSWREPEKTDSQKVQSDDWCQDPDLIQSDKMRAGHVARAKSLVQKSMKLDVIRPSQRDKGDPERKRFSADFSCNETYDALRKCKTVNELSHLSDNEGRSSTKFSNLEPLKIRSYSRLEMEESFNFQEAPVVSTIQFQSNTLPLTKNQEFSSQSKKNLRMSCSELHKTVQRNRRSDTPPLSEMELFDMPAPKRSFNKETIYSSQSGIHHLMVTSPSMDSNLEEELSYVPLVDSHSSMNNNVCKSMPDLSKKKDVKSKAASISYKHFIEQTSSSYKSEFSAKSLKPEAKKMRDELSETSSNALTDSVLNTSALTKKSSTKSNHPSEKQNSGKLMTVDVSNRVDQNDLKIKSIDLAAFDSETSATTQAQSTSQVEPKVAQKPVSHELIRKSSTDSSVMQSDSAISVSSEQLIEQPLFETPTVKIRKKLHATAMKSPYLQENPRMDAEVAGTIQVDLNDGLKIRERWQLLRASLIKKNPVGSQSEQNIDQALSRIDELNAPASDSVINTNTFPLYSSNLWGRKNLIHDLSASYFACSGIPSSVSHSISDLRDTSALTSVRSPVIRKYQPVDTFVSSSLNNVCCRVGIKSNHCTKTFPRSNLSRNYSSTPLFSDNSSNDVKLTRNNFEFNALTLNNSHLTMNLAKNLLNSIVDKQVDDKCVVEGTNNSLENSAIPVEPNFCDEALKTKDQLNFCSGSLKQETSSVANKFCKSNPNNQFRSLDNASLSSMKSNMPERTSKSLDFSERTSNYCDDNFKIIAESSQEMDCKAGLISESSSDLKNDPCKSVEETNLKTNLLSIIPFDEGPKAHHQVKSITENPSSSLNPCGEFDASKLVTNCTLPPGNPLFNSSQSQGAGCKSGDGEGDASSALTIPQSLTPSASKILSQSPAKVLNTHRRSSDSELSVTPKGNSLTGSGGTGMNRTFLPNILLQPITDKKMFELHDYPFLTMTRFPPGFIKRLGGTVSARSVKLLDCSTIDEEPETRDTWWNELRLEVRSHARALACNVILGYSEHTAFNDDVCILSAIGTAATIYFHGNESHHNEIAISGKKKVESKSQNIATSNENRRGGGDANSKRRLISENGDSSDDWPCSMCHVPFKKSSMPFRVSLSKCLLCKRSFVPEILMTTIEPPEGIPILGEGCFLQAFIKRPKRDNRGELNAKEISDSAPFLEYELHRQLLNKLRVKGMNSIFSLKITISVGDRMITGHAAGTAVYLAALPILSLPTVTSGSNNHDVAKLEKIQKDLTDCVKKNRERFLLRPPSVSGLDAGSVTSDSEDSDVDLPEADFAVGNMDLCVLEVDDNEDVDLIPQLIESPPPRNLIVTAAEVLPGVDDLEAVRNIQMFTQVWRGRIPTTAPLSLFSRQFRTMLHKVYFKVRDMVPCALSGIRFLVDIPEPEELQIIVFGMILGLAPCEKSANKHSKRRLFMKTSNSGDSVKKPDENDLIFNLEEETDDCKKSSGISSQAAPLTVAAPVVSKFSGGTPAVHLRPKERYGIDITPLSFVPGARIERYLGNMNLFFIREGTSIRENGGIGVFIHSFVTDVLAIMRAHVAALGGNAVVAYFMNQCILQNNPNKNQAQCLINVGGDAVLVNYRVDE